MKILKHFCISLLTLPVFFSGYMSGCIQLNADSSSFVYTITIQTPGIQREGTPFTIANLSEGDSQWEWKIMDSDDERVVHVSNEKDPTFNLSKGTYDVLITAKGKRNLTRHFRRLITVLPPVFSMSQADEVIDLSSIKTNHVVKDYKSVVRPGYKILLKGSFRGRFKITGLRGTKENPVHIINQGQVTLNAGNEKYPFAMDWGGNNQYILIDGKADPAIPYGFLIRPDSTKIGQMLFISGEFNRGFEICGVNFRGPAQLADGGAALQLQPSFNENCNASNWNFEYLKVHHCKIENAPSEGMYIGYYTDEPRKTGFSPYRLGQVLVYRDTIIKSGWDAIQIASADEFEVHDNYVDGASLAGRRNHSSFVSWNPGNTRGWCYRNTFKNCAHIATIGYGRTGKDAYLYCNLFVEGTFPASLNVRAFFYSRLDNTHQDIGLYMFNNTILTAHAPVRIVHTSEEGLAKIPVVFAGNAILLNELSHKKYPEMQTGNNIAHSPSWIIDNFWRETKKEKEMQWDNNYHPSNKSPLLKANFDVEKQFPSLKGGHYDNKGYPLKKLDGTYTYGCFSGYNLMID